MNVAFIPVRGGSKSIPLKNIKPICGKPLVYWTVKAACECGHIDKVYISTESEKIKSAVLEFMRGEELFSKAEVIGRSERSAADTASTEYAMLEFAENYDFDNIVLIQATSPMLTCTELDCGFEEFFRDGTDSVLSVVRQKRFLWENADDGYAHPINYDTLNRPRRQDFDGYLVENGAFYITSKESLIKSGCRVSGNIRTVEMSEDSYFEIDEESDWLITEALMQKNGFGVRGEIPEIKMLLTDCDGCLTDAGMYYTEHGDEMKKFNTRDGMGFKILREMGIITGIVTGENVDLNRRRAEKLKLDILVGGCDEKADAIMRICRERGISPENTAYIGDDINDLEAIKLVGFGCAPADAMPQVKQAAKFVTCAKGGEGVIREVVERIIARRAE